jgi:hypothetical protein
MTSNQRKERDLRKQLAARVPPLMTAKKRANFMVERVRIFMRIDLKRVKNLRGPREKKAAGMTKIERMPRAMRKALRKPTVAYDLQPL